MILNPFAITVFVRLDANIGFLLRSKLTPQAYPVFLDLTDACVVIWFRPGQPCEKCANSRAVRARVPSLRGPADRPRLHFNIDGVQSLTTLEIGGVPKLIGVPSVRAGRSAIVSLACVLWGSS